MSSSSNSKCQNSKINPRAYVASNIAKNDSIWILDFGATHHLTNENKNLVNNISFSGTNGVTVVHGACVPISYIGQSNTISKLLLLSNAIHTSQATTNLVSIHRLCFDNNVCLEFHSHMFFIMDKHTKKVLLQGPIDRDLYKVLNKTGAIKIVSPEFEFTSTALAASFI